LGLFVTDVVTAALLRLDPGQAADIVWATDAGELYQVLVGQRGWTSHRYKRFLDETWYLTLLGPASVRPFTGNAGPARRYRQCWFNWRWRIRWPSTASRVHALGVEPVQPAAHHLWMAQPSRSAIAGTAIPSQLDTTILARIIQSPGHAGPRPTCGAGVLPRHRAPPVQITASAWQNSLTTQHGPGHTP
jgi:hypothetical protein